MAQRFSESTSSWDRYPPTEQSVQAQYQNAVDYVAAEKLLVQMKQDPARRSAGDLPITYEETRALRALGVLLFQNLARS